MAYKVISTEVSTKELLDNAAAELIAQHGENFSVRDVCSRAGVSVGTFYTYYKSKDEICLARLKYMDRHLMEEVVTSLKGDPGERLVQFTVGYLLRSVERGLTFSREIYKAILFSQVDIETSRKRLIYQFVLELIKEGQNSGIFKAGTDPEQLADMTLTVMRGIAFDWCYKGGSFDIVENAKMTMDIWVKGMYKV